jgi:hypothetical protein
MLKADSGKALWREPHPAALPDGPFSFPSRGPIAISGTAVVWGVTLGVAFRKCYKLAFLFFHTFEVRPQWIFGSAGCSTEFFSAVSLRRSLRGRKRNNSPKTNLKTRRHVLLRVPDHSQATAPILEIAPIRSIALAPVDHPLDRSRNLPGHSRRGLHPRKRVPQSHSRAPDLRRTGHPSTVRFRVDRRIRVRRSGAVHRNTGPPTASGPRIATACAVIMPRGCAPSTALAGPGS